MWIAFKGLNAVNRTVPLLFIAVNLSPSIFGQFSFYLVFSNLFILLANMGGSSRWHRLFIDQKNQYREKVVKGNILANLHFHLFFAGLFAFIFYDFRGADWYIWVVLFIFLRQSEILVFLLEGERKIFDLMAIEVLTFVVISVAFISSEYITGWPISVFYIFIIPQFILFLFLIARLWQSVVKVSIFEMWSLVFKDLLTYNTVFCIFSALVTLLLTRTEILLGKFVLEEEVLGSLALAANIMGFFYLFGTASVVKYLDKISDGGEYFSREAIGKIKFTFWLMVCGSFLGSFALLHIKVETGYPLLFTILGLQILALPLHFLASVWSKKYSLLAMVSINAARNLFSVLVLAFSFLILALNAGPIFVGLALPITYVLGIFGPDLLFSRSRQIAMQRIRIFR